VALVVGFIAVLVLAGIVLLRLAFRRLRSRRYAAGTAYGTCSVALLLLAVGAGFLGLNLLTYERLTLERPVVEVHLVRVADESVDVTLTNDSGATQRAELHGDDWQVYARVLNWQALANLVGFDSVYRLERISGRYSDIARERSASRTVHVLSEPQGIDTWTLLRRWRNVMPWVDAIYGSSVYLPMADDASYQVMISQSGLVARPLNETARKTTNAWK
jgi:hypothetical protein